MENTTYPILLYPIGYINAINSYPLTPKKPLSPIEPSKPIKPADNSKLFMFIGLVFFISSIFFFFNPDIPFILGVFSFILSVVFYLLSNAEEKKQSDFPKMLMIYKNKYEDYLKDKKEYPFLFSNFQKELEKTQSPEFLLKYRNNKTFDFFENTLSPIKTEINEKSVKKGKYEPFFTSLLMDKYPNNIFNSLKLEINHSDKYYVPDIVYWNKNKGNLLIDIEIDEPYDIETGDPIHYIGKDDYRNKYFCDSGWLVIRFTEEQIVKEPTKCIAFLDEVINQLTRKDVINPDDYSQTEIPKLPMWSEDEAHKLAYKRFRDSYIL